MDTTTATPAQIDTEIARLNGEAQKARTTLEAAEATMARIDEAPRYDRDLPWNSPERRAAAQADADTARETIAAAYAAAAPLDAEYDTRGGWTRYFLVTNTGGHVHSSTACTTCFPTTTYAWLTDYSGTSNADLVEEAGTLACTVCFPDAPVDTLRRATRINYEPEEKRARREERERKAAEKAAAEVTVEGYQDYGNRSPRTKTFKSVRAVTNAIASDLGGLCHYGETHPDGAKWVANIAAARAALEARGAEYDYDKALAAARKKVTREGGQPRY